LEADPFLRGGSRLSAPVVTAMRSVGEGDISGYIRALMPGYPSIAHALLRVAMQSGETAKLESWKAGSVESSRLVQEWAWVSPESSGVAGPVDAGMQSQQGNAAHF
jgi:hypothetical protein